MNKFAEMKQKKSSILIGVLLLILSAESMSATSACAKLVGGFPTCGIIHNSLDKTNQKIMLGVNQAGNLNTPDGGGTAETNSLNQTLMSDGKTKINNANSGSVGISYFWDGEQKKDSNDNPLYYTTSNGKTSLTTNSYRATAYMYPKGWYDSTSQGKKWESWSVGGVIANGMQSKEVWASVSEEIGKGSAINVEMKVKSFVVDSTSVKSTVWILNNEEPILEVTHVYGPTSGDTNNTLFQGLVTVTNISGQTLNDVRYRRNMDWDVLDNTGDASVKSYGTVPPVDSAFPPKLWSFCANGGEDNVHANPYVKCDTTTKSDFKDTLNLELDGSHGQIGSSFDFQLGNLNCNESADFYIYYGAANSIESLITAMKQVGATMYSIGYDPKYKTLAYTFGFKGLSGTAVAPTLPTKVAALPSGASTVPYDPTGNTRPVYQTYASPVLGDKAIYQALFQFQKDKQWVGEIKKYTLDSSGGIAKNEPLLATTILKKQASNIDQSSSNGGRSIWTVGMDPMCPGSTFLPGDPYNNFIPSNSALLEKLLYNCPSSVTLETTKSAEKLIKFIRGLNSYNEDPVLSGSVRESVLGDTFHSEMVLVGPPNAPVSSDKKIFEKSEAYFRFNPKLEDLTNNPDRIPTGNYTDWASNLKNRPAQLYVGSNDGMLHAFDPETLSERWAFVPPPVISILRNMAGDDGGSNSLGVGKSNSIFTVDGPIAVKDVYFEGQGTWKTVLMGGLGWGGNGYYALDITDPIKPRHLFSFYNDVANKSVNYWNSSGVKSTFPYSSSCKGFDYSKLGGTWSRPVIMLLPYNKNSTKQRWVAVFGGGYAGGASVTGRGSVSSFGAYVFVTDFEPDDSISTLNCGANSAAAVQSTGGHTLIEAIPLCDANPLCTAPSGDPKSNIPNGVTANLSVITGDGTVHARYYGGIAYFTDLQGELWKFNISKNELSDDNSKLFNISRAFIAEGTLQNDRLGFNQVGTTIVSMNGANTLFNYFGTGDQTRIQRRVSTINNRIYGVPDTDFPSATIANGNNNKVVSDSNNIINNSCNGTGLWYADVSPQNTFDRSADFQKIVGRASVFNKYVYFSAYEPEFRDCPKYGQSRLIEITDACNSGTAGGAGGIIGQGLATPPVIDSKGNIYVGMSNLSTALDPKMGKDNIAKLASSAKTTTGRVQYKSWREKRAY